MLKRILKITGIVLGAVVVLLVGLIAFLSITEYHPDPAQDAEHIIAIENGSEAGESLTLYSWNIGYAGLGEESDFFMDGGEMVYPPSQEIVEKNFAGIRSFLQENPADVWLLQEVDVSSAHTDYMDQFSLLQSALEMHGALAYNYNCLFVPIPMPPIGKVQSGIATYTSLEVTGQPQRVSLPCPFSWPVSAANLKRCLLVTRIPVADSDKELVIINLHLEAYEDGAGRIAQTRQLVELMEAEYEAGNYVIAGGDFNQSFPGTLDTYPIADSSTWAPGLLEQSSLPEGWQYAYDGSTPTCRLLDAPLSDACQRYVIDGFILSPNVQLELVETVSLGFACSDHNPVRLDVTLLP